MIQAIALDTDPLVSETLSTFCRQTGNVVLTRTFSQPDEARYYLRGHPVDLVFMEVNLPGESGINFWRSIRQDETGNPATANGQLPMLIFTTSSSDYALISYELQAIDYLLKPFSFDRFERAVQKAVNWLSLSNTAPKMQLTLPVDWGLVRIDISDILWIEALSNYLKIHLSDQRFLVVRMTMKAMLQRLPSTDFVRVHRSYIVSINRVQAIHNKLIQIGEKRIPLSANHHDFCAFLRNYQSSSQFLPRSSH